MTVTTNPSANGASAVTDSVDPAITAKKELEQRKLSSLLSKTDALEMSQNSENNLDSVPSNNTIPDDGTGVVHLDPWLGPWKDEIRHRYNVAKGWIDKFNKYEGGLGQFSKVCAPVYMELQLELPH